MMNEILDRMVKNIKLSIESFGVISLELGKVASYWVIFWTDTKSIYKIFKKFVSKLKKILWQK